MKPNLPVVLLLIASTVCAVGCGKKERPRSYRQINEERRSLDVLFLTADTQQEFIAPGNTNPPVIDKATGELCWPAFVCNNPDCPGKDLGENGRPFLFTHPNPLVKLGPGGELVIEEIGPHEDPYEAYETRGGHIDPTCPECWKIRNPKSESITVAQQYIDWVKPYVLPETARRLEELEEEYQQRKNNLEERRNRPPPGEE